MQAEVETAQAAFHLSRDQAQEQRERAEKAERSLADVVELFNKGRGQADDERRGVGYGDKMSPVSASTDGMSLSSSGDARDMLSGQWIEGAQGKGQVRERGVLCCLVYSVVCTQGREQLVLKRVSSLQVYRP